jgi:RNA polymerase sigma-70 factor (ECF subfamily)
MNSRDTSLGGAEARFPETATGVGADSEALARLYWKPVYAYVRLAWAKSNEDAKDLTQAFFLWLFEDRALDGYDSTRGGFRPYLKVLLRRFVGHQDRALNALRRGGSARRLDLDGTLPVLASRESDPEAAFERVCLEEVLNGALETVRRRLTAVGREGDYRVYEAYVLAPEQDRPTYAELARTSNLTEKDVDRILAAVRADVRQAARDALARDAGTGSVDDEWRRFLGS